MAEAEIKELSQYLKDGSVDYDKLMSGDYILVVDNDVAKGSSGELPMVLRHPAPA